jgi:predicted RecA/RadA family phage recombinase
MAKNFVQPGNVLDYTNGTGSDIASGDVVVIGGLLGVALDDIADGDAGVVQITGVFTLPKVSGAVIAQGESLVWDVTAGAFDDNQATPATDDVSGAAAVAAAAGADGETTLLVRLTGVPGTVTA